LHDAGWNTCGSTGTVEQIDAAGSLRRWRATIGDIDLVAATKNPSAVMEAFIHSPEVSRVLGQGENKSSIETHNGLKLQLWTQPPERYGSLLLFVTGSKDHNVRLRELAQKQGLSLSEHGLVDEEGNEQVFATEKDVYAALGYPYIEPELREDRGEFQAARAGKLPELVTTPQIRAELHTHSTWSDGAVSIRDMAAAARERGFTTLAVTDHTHSLGIVTGMHPEDAARQRIEIEGVQREMGDSIRILQGAEVEIRADGSLDYPDEVLASLDIVIASLHVSLRQPREVVTQRMINAIQNPNVDIIAHPSGRLLPNREGADLDYDAVLSAARQHGTALEINASPNRLDLDEMYVRRAVEMGIPIAINTDAHAPDQLDLMEYGVSVARRAWVSADKIISTWLVQKGNFTKPDGHKAMAQLIDLPDPPTAVISGNNTLTLGALQAIHAHSIRVPDELSIIGFDDTDWATSMQPPLSVIAQPTYEIGRRATELLLERMD
jgi:DNA polymerase (family X)